uniref:Membrane-associated lipoprotein n=1 Tax=Mycoplasma feriruminatoris TaxID=1179777 RepID=A0A654IHD0_9MOLU|nr:Membrane-associated lipoprotein [Mycoplasma feriruminatoris]
MKSLNKLLVLLSSSTLALPLTLIVACKPTKAISKPIDDKEFLRVVESIKTENDLLKYADIKFKDSRGSYISKDDVIPSQLEKSQIEITFKEKYKNQIFAKVLSINSNLNSDGVADINSVRLYVEFKNTKTNTPKPINFELTGLNKNGTINPFMNSSVNTLEYFNDAGGFDSYSNKSQKDRFKYDNEKYIKSLESQISPDKKPINLKDYRKLETSEDNISKFDQKANENNFDTYYSAALKGFTLPVYEKDGKFKGLQINDGPEVNKGPSTVDSLGRDRFKTNGLARTIPNETYRTAAIQTFQVDFTGWKDYSAEIEEAEDNIKLFKLWNDKQIKNYLDQQLNQLRLNYEDETKQIDKKLSESSDEYETIIKNLTDQKNKLKEEYDKKYKEISELTKDKLVEWQTKEIEEYKKKSKENKYQTSESGTMWVLDYLKEDNNNNPTKFYFGTNSHVAKAIKDDLVSFSLTRINENIKVGQTFDLNGFDKNFTKFSFTPKNGKRISQAVSAIFHATDFIKQDSNPVKLLTNGQEKIYGDAGIFADFAVVEIDFDKLLNEGDYSRSIWSESKDISHNYEREKTKLIADITNNYSTNTDKQVKFVSMSLLEDNNYKKFDRSLDFDSTKSEEVKKYEELESIYILGYPTANEDYYLDQYEDYKQIERKKYDFSLWVNSEYKYYKKLSKNEGTPSSFNEYETKKGNFFSYEIGYRSFIDKPGLTDAFLAAHRVGRKLYSLPTDNNGKSKKYFNYGLEFLPRFYAPAGGASGSSVRTKDNKLLAVYHASNNVAKTGLAAAFRSNGYNYNELFGKYNLGQYDLIYGNGKDQEKDKSYREVLLKKYPEKKSALFKDGFKEENIPEEFKFKNPTK